MNSIITQVAVKVVEEISKNIEKTEFLKLVRQQRTFYWAKNTGLCYGKVTGTTVMLRSFAGLKAV